MSLVREETCQPASDVGAVTRSAMEQSRNYIRRKAILDAAEEIYAA